MYKAFVKSYVLIKIFTVDEVFKLIIETAKLHDGALRTLDTVCTPHHHEN